MRVFVFGALVCLLVAGCKSSEKPDAPNDPKPPAEKRGNRAKAPEPPQITPVNILSGRVVMVNVPLRYVVIDFGVGRLPQPDQRLDVYRQGKKIGEVRISNQARMGNVAADIMLGESAQGDEIRGMPAEGSK